VNTPSSSALDLASLDTLTGGALTAPTSGERAARLREWMATEPSADLLQQVFKEMSSRDKGAAKPLREKLDDLRRLKSQDALADEWAEKAKHLLDIPRLNLADAMAWPRDAAKAGAPLSREPLASMRLALADRVKHIEDLEHRAQVLRESAVLMVQRIEVLSTKAWTEAVELQASLSNDLQRLQAELAALSQDPHWVSVDAKYPSSVLESTQHIHLVWDAFSAALAQTQAAAQDPSLPLPAVPAWADQLRVLRGETSSVAAPKPAADPAVQAETKKAQAASKAAASLQKQQADAVRTELVAKAEALMKPVKPEGEAVVEGQEVTEWQPVITGRKLQDSLRQLREAWKKADQGGQPNHGLWKRFDQACNRAYPFVQAWIEKAKAESAAHREQRVALLAEVAAWTQEHSGNTDWKKQARELQAFTERWRSSGHLSEKLFADMQAQWKTAMQAAHAAIDKAQADSVALRRAMIEEAKQLGAAASLRIDAVKALQQRWQLESQAVPVDRKLAQKLWDAFRQPLDEAFQRKTADRSSQAQQPLSAHDQAVLDASHTLEKAIAAGDASAIRQAMQHLNDVSLGRAPAATSAPQAAAAETNPTEAPAVATVEAATDETSEASVDVATETSVEVAAEPAPVVKAPAPAKKVVAVRGDDRPGQKKTEPTPAGRFGDKPGARRNDGPPGRRGPDTAGPRRGADAPRGRDAFEPRGPRLGDAAFRAQRHALEQADNALRRLAMQAHGETLVNLMSAWEQRQAEQLPAAKELDSRVSAAQRQAWSQALQAAPQGAADNALLRLEMAAEVPTPAAHVDARRALQLQLLTKRHDAPPLQTWAQDVASVLAAPFDAEAARRVQAALKVLLKR
jgi:ATP-dependent RNA helicase SUPV3L1/SUV3